MFRANTADKSVPLDKTCPLHTRPPQCRACFRRRELHRKASFRLQYPEMFTQQLCRRQSLSGLFSTPGLVRRSTGALQRVRCKAEGNEEDDKQNDGRRPPPKRSRKPLGWLREVLGSVRSQKSIRIIFNVAGLLLLMRFWPLNGRNPLTGDSANVSIEVCYLGHILGT